MERRDEPGGERQDRNGRRLRRRKSQDHHRRGAGRVTVERGVDDPEVAALLRWRGMLSSNGVRVRNDPEMAVDMSERRALCEEQDKHETEPGCEPGSDDSLLHHFGDIDSAIGWFDATARGALPRSRVRPIALATAARESIRADSSCGVRA